MLSGAAGTDRRTDELGLYDRTKCDFSDTTKTEVEKIYLCAYRGKIVKTACTQAKMCAIAC